jgi:nitrogen fixation NifU-like protein
MDMYSENVLDRYRSPRFRRELASAALRAHDVNPVCGDDFTLFVQLGPDGRVVDASFTGVGCAISTASADMLCEACIGKSLDELRLLDKDFAYSLLGVPISAVRAKCALLPLKVLKLAVYSHLGQKLLEKEGEFG